MIFTSQVAVKDGEADKICKLCPEAPWEGRMGWGLQGRLKTGQEPWPWSPHHGAFTLLAAGTGRRDAAGQRKGGTGCCVDKASADPRDLWSWGGPLEPGTGHQASASHTHHWTRAPWGSSAVGKAIPIGAASETPPAAGGCPPFLVEHQASGISYPTNSSLQTLGYFSFIPYDSKVQLPTLRWLRCLC